MTLVVSARPVVAATSGVRVPRIVPAAVTGPRSDRSRPSRSARGADQSPVAWSMRPVVDAFVASQDWTPLSQYPRRSGMSSARWAGLGLGGELEERVERLRLDAGGREQVFGAHLREGFRFGVGAARVAVADGVGDQVPRGVDEAVVDRPGVHPDRGGVAEGAEPVEDARPQAEDVPVQASAHGDGAVGEPGDLCEVDPVPVQAGGHDAPRGRPEVDRRHHSGAFTPARGSERLGGATGAGHLRNPCGLPESTGMCTPVVKPRSGPTSAYTASATVEGSTSRLRRVRPA